MGSFFEKFSLAVTIDVQILGEACSGTFFCDTDMNKAVAIIILNWNGWQDTIECVKSCLKLTFADYRILIVDNGSTDGSEAILRKRFPGIDILQTGSNIGFAGGNNIGIRYAIENDAEYVWLLNNDTVVDAEALTELVCVAESDYRIGAVGSKIFYYDQPELLWFAGGGLNKLTKLAYHIGSKQKDSKTFEKNHEIDFITGCSLLVKTRTITDVGMMQEEFFLYAEDTEWNIRIRKSGWKTKWAANSKVWHKVSRSSGGDSPFLNYYCVRNILRYVRLNFPFHLPFTLMVLFYHYIILKVIQRNFPAVKWSFIGFNDFLHSRFGKYEEK